jgi:UTP-glucose-1-phosphate uridylyltransferase
MIKLDKKLFYEVFDKNIDLYNDFINTMKEDYNRIIQNISNATSIEEIRRNTHTLIGTISVFEIYAKNELLLSCINMLNLDKNDKTIKIENYIPYIKEIVDFDKTKLGL